MSMLNLAGTSYDFGNVLFAVLQECEHRRRGLLENEVSARLGEIARAKLEEIHASYVESGGSPAYWRELAAEVLDNVLPQYAAAAAEQNRLERSSYDLWRGGDAVARCVLGFGGLALGGLIVAAPFIPIWEDAFAFVLSACGFLYPELKRMLCDWRHARMLNGLIVQAEKYQKNSRIHYTSEAELDAALRAIAPGGKGEGAEELPAPPERDLPAAALGPRSEEPGHDGPAPAAPGGAVGPHHRQRERS